MNVELFPFQKKAILDIRIKTAEAMGSYHRSVMFITSVSIPVYLRLKKKTQQVISRSL